MWEGLVTRLPSTLSSPMSPPAYPQPPGSLVPRSVSLILPRAPHSCFSWSQMYGLLPEMAAGAEAGTAQCLPAGSPAGKGRAVPGPLRPITQLVSYGCCRGEALQAPGTPGAAPHQGCSTPSLRRGSATPSLPTGPRKRKWPETTGSQKKGHG